MGTISSSPWGTAVLLSLVLPLAPQTAEHLRALKELEQRIADESRTWRDFRDAAASAEERAELRAAFPEDELAAELAALAEAARGTEVAARAWLETFRLGALLDERALLERGLERLLAEHMQSPEIAGLTLELVYGAPEWSAPLAADALRTILAGNTGAAVQANGLAQLALLVGLDPRFGEAGRAEARTLLARIEERYATSDFVGMTGAAFAAGARFEMDHLRVGQVAPDFEVVDQDGAPFRLGDYRGRVVVLDFWGFV